MKHLKKVVHVVVLISWLNPTLAFTTFHPSIIYFIDGKRSSLQRWTTSSLKSVESNIQNIRHYAPSNSVSLRWVVQSIERNIYGEVEYPFPELLDALKDLENARTQKRVTEVGRRLDQLPLEELKSSDLLERIIKVTAIAGLLTISLRLFDNLLTRAHQPCDIAFTAVCKSLRQARRTTQMEQLLKRVAIVSNLSQSPVTFNIYLASLCDVITKRDLSHRRNLPMSEIGYLEKARTLLKPGVASDLYRVQPDVSSYSTVLHAAASVGNRDMVQELWVEMKQAGIVPNRYIYNALLKSICSEGQAFDAEAIDLLDQMIQDPLLQPDGYTIDLALMPILRIYGIPRLTELVMEFAMRNGSEPSKIERAISSFLNTLVMEGEIQAAQTLFHATMPGKSVLATSVPKPSTRRYNILLTGLRNSALRSKSNVEKADARDEMYNLYQIMMSSNVKPDEYTFTIMLGTIKNTLDIISLLCDAIIIMDIEVTPVVLRALLTACGDNKDPSSACYLFDMFHGEVNDIKTWNALLGSLSESASAEDTPRLMIGSSDAANYLRHNLTNLGTLPQTLLSPYLEGLTYSMAAKKLLQLMNGNILVPFRTPKPNSQTYCLVASALQYNDDEESSHVAALELFQNATRANIPVDGRFVNAVFRCFGSNIDGALKAWKGGIRQKCLSSNTKSTKESPLESKTLLAAYHGLLHVCGRALRPDIALRVVYAMNKEKGVVVNEMSLQCYQSGKRKALGDSKVSSQSRSSVVLGEQFESLLTVECTNYDSNDKRRQGDRRVRIIL
jgi:pentatricopeptide repeat protein